MSALRALQLLVHRLVDEVHPLAAFDTVTMSFWRTAKESQALRARARELRSELERALTTMLRESVGAREAASAPLVTGMLTAAWCTAFASALRKRRSGGSAAAARKEFLRGLDEAFAILTRGSSLD